MFMHPKPNLDSEQFSLTTRSFSPASIAFASWVTQYGYKNNAMEEVSVALVLLPYLSPWPFGTPPLGGLVVILLLFSRSTATWRR